MRGPGQSHRRCPLRLLLRGLALGARLLTRFFSAPGWRLSHWPEHAGDQPQGGLIAQAVADNGLMMRPKSPLRIGRQSALQTQQAFLTLIQPFLALPCPEAFWVIDYNMHRIVFQQGCCELAHIVDLEGEGAFLDVHRRALCRHRPCRRLSGQNPGGNQPPAMAIPRVLTLLFCLVISSPVSSHFSCLPHLPTREETGRWVEEPFEKDNCRFLATYSLV